MKVIDLLNKIANGEEVPKKIKIKDEIWIYDDEIDYKAEDNRGYLFEVHTRINKEDLNDEIEIIEEDKKIERLPHYDYSQIMKCKNKDKFVEKLLEKHDLRLYNYHEKINELIDEVNRLKENKEWI